MDTGAKAVGELRERPDFRLLPREVFDKTTKNCPPPGFRLPDAGFPGLAHPGSAGVPPATGRRPD